MENAKVSKEQKVEICKLYEMLINLEPSLPLSSYKEWTSLVFNINISKTWISDVLYHEMGYSKKKSVIWNIGKFTEENVDYYMKFLFFISKQDPKKIKVLDESHFDGRSSKVRFGRAKKGKKSYQTNSTPLKEKCSLSLIVALSETEPFYYTLREDSNDEFDFLQFILDALEDGFLVEGDILLIDNASIHTAEITIALIHDLCLSKGVRIVRLPTYSPELSVCELVFAFIKNKIYNGGVKQNTLMEEIDQSLGEISYKNLEGFYYHCLINFGESKK